MRVGSSGGRIALCSLCPIKYATGLCSLYLGVFFQFSSLFILWITSNLLKQNVLARLQSVDDNLGLHHVEQFQECHFTAVGENVVGLEN